MTEALDDFELAFEAQKIGWSGGQPTADQARAAAGRTARQAPVVTVEEVGASLPLPRPRDMTQIARAPGFAEIQAELWEMFHDEIIV